MSIRTTFFACAAVFAIAVVLSGLSDLVQWQSKLARYEADEAEVTIAQALAGFHRASAADREAFSSELANAIQTLSENNPGHDNPDHDSQGERFAARTALVGLAQSRLKGELVDPRSVSESLASVLAEHQAREHTHRGAEALHLLGVFVFLLLAIPAVYWFLTKRVVRPLAAVTHALDKLADGDLSTFVPHIDDGGDVGRLARAAYRFKQESRENIRLRNEQDTYREGVQRQQQTLLTSLADRFELEIGRIAKSLVDSSDRLADAAQTVADDAEVAGGSADAARQKADTSRDTVDSVSKAGDTIRVTAMQMNKAINEVVGRINELNTGVSEAGSRFQNLQEASRQINDVVTVISEITERTNLLALNAGIEAAHAGDAGHGFAVVAREVKSLAQQTAGATEQIGSEINIMLEQIRGSGTAMNALRGMVEATAGAAREIADAALRQGRIAEEVDQSIQVSADRLDGILNDVSEFSSLVQASRSATRDLQGAADQIQATVQVLQSETESFLAGIREEGQRSCEKSGEVELF